MPMCARCLGASIGHTIALILFILDSLPTFAASIFFAGVMLSDWTLQYLKILQSTNSRRLVTGILGGLGVGSIIWSIISCGFSLIMGLPN